MYSLEVDVVSKCKTSTSNPRCSPSKGEIGNHIRRWLVVHVQSVSALDAINCHVWAERPVDWLILITVSWWSLDIISVSVSVIFTKKNCVSSVFVQTNKKIQSLILRISSDLNLYDKLWAIQRYILLSYFCLIWGNCRIIECIGISSHDKSLLCRVESQIVIVITTLCNSVLRNASVEGLQERLTDPYLIYGASQLVNSNKAVVSTVCHHAA